jgi:hypothetical protein
MFMTLTLRLSRGWCVFGIGDHVPPDAIDFGGSLNAEVMSRGPQGNGDHQGR